MMPQEPKSILRKALVLILCVALIPIVIVALPIGILTGIFGEFRTGSQRRAFLRKWEPRRALLVYSNSPIWQAYVEAHWLPRLKDKVVLLNWSERSTWEENWHLEATLFRAYLGNREFNPAVIVFDRKPSRTPWQSLRSGNYLDAVLLIRKDVTVIRFWQAFRDFKHGKDSLLRAQEAELFARLGADGGAV